MANKENKNISKLGKIRKNVLVLSVILPVCLGLIAGVVGELLSRTYITGNVYSIPFWREVNLTDEYRGSNLIIRDAKKVVVEQNDKVIETINSVNASVVGVFKKQPSVADETKVEFNLANYYKLNQAISSGLIITSDGWIITNAFIPNANINNILSGYVIVTKDKKIYEIDKAIKDTVSSFYFIHVAGVRDLPVRQFSSLSDLGGGQLAIAIDWPDKSWLSSIIGLEQETIALKFSDNFSKNLILADDLSVDLSGAIVFNLAGNIVGLMNREGEIKPITQFTAAIASLLKDGEIRRPSLGINYIDLSSLIAAGKNIAGYKQGALIYKNLDGVDVVKGSPAYLAGLRSGDIITHIDNIEVNGNNDLIAILQNYLAGDKITVRYFRDKQGEEVGIKLGRE